MREVMQKLGLTKSEAKVYLSILSLGRTNVSRIAQESSLNRRNVYDVLHTLLDKGLIFQSISQKEGLYAAVEPEKLLELAQSKELALKKIMPDLEALYAKEFKKEQAIMYKGIEGFKQYLQDILNIGEDVYCIGAKGGWGNPALGEYADWFKQERIKQNIQAHNLFDIEMKAFFNGEKESYFISTDEYKYLPAELSTNSAIDIFGDRIVTFTGLSPEKFDEDVTLFVITSQEIADACRIWFQFLWDSSVES